MNLDSVDEMFSSLEKKSFSVQRVHYEFVTDPNDSRTVDRLLEIIMTTQKLSDDVTSQNLLRNCLSRFSVVIHTLSLTIL